MYRHQWARSTHRRLTNIDGGRGVPEEIEKWRWAKRGHTEESEVGMQKRGNMNTQKRANGDETNQYKSRKKLALFTTFTFYLCGPIETQDNVVVSQICLTFNSLRSPDRPRPSIRRVSPSASSVRSVVHEEKEVSVSIFSSTSDTHFSDG